MARGLNKVMLIGHVGGDPKTRSTPGGTSIANFSVATTEQWVDKSTGEKKERTEWHNCDVWGRGAEIAAEYLRKGSQVYIEGSIRTEEWKDKDTGADRKATKIRVENFQMLGGGGQRAGRPAEPQASAPAQASFDDDIPF
jgi:single-strand DNA-binding protein